jgi:hypothetical protein
MLMSTHLRLDIKLRKLLLIPLRRIIIAGIHPNFHLSIETGINIRGGIETMRRRRRRGLFGFFVHGEAVAMDGGNAKELSFFCGDSLRDYVGLVQLWGSGHGIGLWGWKFEFGRSCWFVVGHTKEM